MGRVTRWTRSRMGRGQEVAPWRDHTRRRPSAPSGSSVTACDAGPARTSSAWSGPEVQTSLRHEPLEHTHRVLQPVPPRNLHDQGYLGRGRRGPQANDLRLRSTSRTSVAVVSPRKVAPLPSPFRAPIATIPVCTRIARTVSSSISWFLGENGSMLIGRRDETPPVIEDVGKVGERGRRQRREPARDRGARNSQRELPPLRVGTVVADVAAPHDVRLPRIRPGGAISPAVWGSWRIAMSPGRMCAVSSAALAWR